MLKVPGVAKCGPFTNQFRIYTRMRCVRTLEQAVQSTCSTWVTRGRSAAVVRNRCPVPVALPGPPSPAYHRSQRHVLESMGGLQVSVASIPTLLLLVAPAMNLKLNEQRGKVTVSVAGTLAGTLAGS